MADDQHPRPFITTHTTLRAGPEEAFRNPKDDPTRARLAPVGAEIEAKQYRELYDESRATIAALRTQIAGLQSQIIQIQQDCAELTNRLCEGLQIPESDLISSSAPFDAHHT